MKDLAIANCRVSSDEQLLNNSLNRQEAMVLKAAQELSVEIPDDGWWSGSVSSKKGTNVNRKDLQEMIDYCKKHKRVKYLIVDEPDRFMRSIDEAAYFEVTFRQLGVTVWYASDPELNKGDLAAKLLKFTKYLSAEGSNEERQRKSISGQTMAIKEGRWPFVPKPGYKKGYQTAIPEIHEIRGPALKKVLVDIASRRVTPTQGLINLNDSEFMVGHSRYKMDKFRTIVTDPFYASILDVNKQVRIRNENGLHEALITKEQHYILLDIMHKKSKSQSGPRKNGNPRFPCNNIVTCELCTSQSNGRVVGSDHSNGASKTKVWSKYRCRACKRYISRDVLHEEIARQFKSNPITTGGINDLKEALEIVWKQNEASARQEADRLEREIIGVEEYISRQVEAATDPTNLSIKQDILELIEKKREVLSGMKVRLLDLRNGTDRKKDDFLDFAFWFADNMGSKFLEVSQENRLKCKQIMFPAGFYWNADGKVYTPEISPLIRLAGTKKDSPLAEKSSMVQHS